MLAAALLHAPARAGTIACGTYTATGTLTRGHHGHFRLSLRPGSTSHFELFLLGGDWESKTLHLRTRVQATFYVPKPIKGWQAPYVYLQRLEPGPTDPRSIDELELIETKPCGLRTLFQTN